MTTKNKEDKEVVFLADGRITLDPNEFKDEKLALEEYLYKFKEHPSIGFDAFQRTYAALRMFGKEKSEKPGKPGRWKFLDDRVDKPNKKPGMGALYGVEDVAESIMAYLADACVSKDTQGRFILLYGPPSSAKTNLIELMSDALDSFSTLPEGGVYTVKWKLDDVPDLFGGLTEIACPAHESPLNFVEKEELTKIVEGANKGKPAWQHIQPRTTRCPTCNYISRVLKKAGKLEKMEDRIEVVRVFPGVDVNRYEFRPTAEKAYDPTLIFGGAINFERLSRFMSKDHPLVLDYGIGGTINGPSPQHHLVHFSEMYKGGEEFLNEMLDLVQSRTVIVKGKYEVPVDAVFIGTTNLEEFEKMKTLPQLGDYLTSRSYPIGAGYLLVLDDQGKALKERVFYSPKRKLTYHIPPHFVEEVLSTMAVLGALDDPKSELKITLLQKAQVYNGEMPHGLEYNLDELFWELWSDAHHKPSSDVTEGVRRGVPFRFFQELPIKFSYSLAKLPLKTKKDNFDQKYEDGCVGMLTIKPLLEGIVKTYDGVSDETRERIVKEILPIAWDIYEDALAKDVNRAILGEKRIIGLGTKYIAQAYESVRGRKEYLDLRGQKLPIDEEFMKYIEQASGVRNPGEFREALANHVKYRKGDFTKIVDGQETLALDALTQQLISENPTFRRAIEEYAITRILPNLVDDISIAYSEANEPLIKDLEKMGYCRACGSIAIQAAARKRRSK